MGFKRCNPLVGVLEFKRGCCSLGGRLLWSSRRVRGTPRMASWRSGYAEDCKSLHPGSIPGEASNNF
ncbi:MAG: hypothetical protein K0Q68_3228 [Moraxellaceae bacterium]|nr:hypothetical protein [Moraxellaceae bacterium]MCD6070568.1 hypothetical protein [Microvirga sp.]MDF2974643.1 hypothetical protein [Microvirga sp.]